MNFQQILIPFEQDEIICVLLKVSSFSTLINLRSTCQRCLRILNDTNLLLELGQIHYIEYKINPKNFWDFVNLCNIKYVTKYTPYYRNVSDEVIIATKSFCNRYVKSAPVIHIKPVLLLITAIEHSNVEIVEYAIELIKRSYHDVTDFCGIAIRSCVNSNSETIEFVKKLIMKTIALISEITAMEDCKHSYLELLGSAIISGNKEIIKLVIDSCSNEVRESLHKDDRNQLINSVLDSYDLNLLHNIWINYPDLSLIQSEIDRVNYNTNINWIEELQELDIYTRAGRRINTIDHILIICLVTLNENLLQKILHLNQNRSINLPHIIDSIITMKNLTPKKFSLTMASLKLLDKYMYGFSGCQICEIKSNPRSVKTVQPSVGRSQSPQIPQIQPKSKSSHNSVNKIRQYNVYDNEIIFSDAIIRSGNLDVCKYVYEKSNQNGVVLEHLLIAMNLYYIDIVDWLMSIHKQWDWKCIISEIVTIGKVSLLSWLLRLCPEILSDYYSYEFEEYGLDNVASRSYHVRSYHDPIELRPIKPSEKCDEEEYDFKFMTIFMLILEKDNTYMLEYIISKVPDPKLLAWNKIVFKAIYEIRSCPNTLLRLREIDIEINGKKDAKKRWIIGKRIAITWGI